MAGQSPLERVMVAHVKGCVVWVEDGLPREDKCTQTTCHNIFNGCIHGNISKGMGYVYK